jgi:hypothetical protein
MDADSAAHGPVDLTDILALVVVVLASLRRLDVKVAQHVDHPRVPGPAFDAWRQAALGAYSLAIHASLLKVILNNLWFYVGRRFVPHPLLAAGGATLFIAWVVALTIAWRRATTARLRQAELGIVMRGRRDAPRGPN